MKTYYNTDLSQSFYVEFVPGDNVVDSLGQKGTVTSVDYVPWVDSSPSYVVSFEKYECRNML